MKKPLIAITGKNGQLGWELQQAAHAYEDTFDFLFVGRDQLDLSNLDSIFPFFEKYQPSYFINCAAYTAVDKAETEQAAAYLINASAVGAIALASSLHQCTLLTLSSDYVFNGQATAPYATDAPTEPVNYYGFTKEKGEQLALQNNSKTLVIRTSWVYSTHGHNFVNTMLRLLKERSEMKVVNDQFGSPTYAADLAAALLQIIVALQLGNTHYGIYHFSNEGIISWYQFAQSIREASGTDCQVLPIPSTEYPLPAKRPAYSGLDKSGLVRDFGVELKGWESGLERYFSLL